MEHDPHLTIQLPPKRPEFPDVHRPASDPARLADLRMAQRRRALVRDGRRAALLRAADERADRAIAAALTHAGVGNPALRLVGESLTAQDTGPVHAQPIPPTRPCQPVDEPHRNDAKHVPSTCLTLIMGTVGVLLLAIILAASLIEWVAPV